MEEKTIKVIIKKPDEKPVVTEIGDNYEALSSCIDGMLEFVRLPADENVDAIVNDSFLYNGMQEHANFIIPEYETIICGPVVIAGYDSSNGNTISLTDKQAEKALKYLEENSVEKMSAGIAYVVAKEMKEQKIKTVKAFTDKYNIKIVTVEDFFNAELGK